MTHHPSFGLSLGVDLAGGSSYTTIPQVRDVALPSLTRGSVDVTAHDAADGWRQFIPGVPDGGEFGFQLGWDPGGTTHNQSATGVLSDFDSDGCTLPSWQLTLNVCSGTVTWTFDGFMTGAGGTAAVEGELLLDCTVKVSGKPVLAVT